MVYFCVTFKLKHPVLAILMRVLTSEVLNFALFSILHSSLSEQVSFGGLHLELKCKSENYAWRFEHVSIQNESCCGYWLRQLF